MQKKVYVLGHGRPDIDTIVSAKIFSEILSEIEGIEVKYAVISGRDDMDLYNQKMINACMDYAPVVLQPEEIDEHLYYLVDHNDLSQSIGTQNKDLVLGCIDHHPDSGQLEQPIITDYCCCALYIYDKFKSIYPFTIEQKYQIFMAFLNDSIFTKSSRCRKEDIELAETLGFSKDYDELLRTFFIPTSLGEENVYYKNGHKQFFVQDEVIDSSYMERLDTIGIDNYYKFIENYPGNFLGLWSDFQELKSYAYLKYLGNVYKKEYNTLAPRGTKVVKDMIAQIQGKHTFQLVKKNNSKKYNKKER